MHKMDLFFNHEERDERGQSLVEFVLVLPIILVMIAGVLEVTNIILVYNNVQQAAREGARYGAGGGVDNGVDEVVLDTITNNLNEDNVESIWVIRPQAVIVTGNTVGWADSGTTPPWGVQEVCIYPKPCTDTTSKLSSGMVLTELNRANSEILTQFSGRSDLVNAIGGEILTIVVVNYKAQTILNLSFFDYFGPDGTLPLQAWTIMRQEVESETLEKFNSGCSSYPMILNLLALGGNNNTTRLFEASEGDEFKMQANSAPMSGYAEGYGYLQWDGTASLLPGTLPADLANPSTSLTTFIDAQNYADTSLHRGNWVMATGVDHDDVIYDHMNAGRALRVAGYYYFEDLTPPHTKSNPGTDKNGLNRAYKVDEFLIVKIVIIEEPYITFEFLRLDNSCGYDLDS